MDVLAASEDENSSSASGDDDSSDDVAELMVTNRERRKNAGSNMKPLIAVAEEEGIDEEQEMWGEEWEEAPDEEDFVGNDGEDQGDYNLDSSDSEDEDAGDDDDEGEKELRRAERQERNKKRKAGANPFATSAATMAKKKAKLDVPTPASNETTPAPRPAKRVYTHLLPGVDDGPARQSSRRQTVANKQETTERLKLQEAHREKTLAQMKAAEERKDRAKPKAMTQEERLAEAAKVEKQNSKSLHRWEEAEERRAADRQAKLDALKSRELEGPFFRQYSGPAIWIDNKLKYTGRDAPKVEELDERLNSLAARTKEAKRLQDAAAAKAREAARNAANANGQNDTNGESSTNSQGANPQGGEPSTNSQELNTQGDAATTKGQPGTQPEPVAASVPQVAQPGILPLTEPAQSATLPPPQQAQPTMLPPTTTLAQPEAYPNSIMFAPPQNPDSFLFGIEHWAALSDPNNLPFGSPSLPPHPNPLLYPLPPTQTPQLQAAVAVQSPPPPPPIPKKDISLALRSLTTLCSFPTLDPLPPYHPHPRHLPSKKNPALTATLSAPLFAWSAADALAFASLQPSKYNTKNSALPMPEQLKCVITGLPAWYRDPGTGLGYRDAYAFKCVKRVLNGGVRWCGALGCYVGPVFAGGGVVGGRPARGVPERFLGLRKEVHDGEKENVGPEVAKVKGEVVV